MKTLLHGIEHVTLHINDGLLGGFNIIEAIFDAINRPYRDEPLLAEVNGYSHSAGTVLVSARPGKHKDLRKFYFPIGRSNYLVAKHAIASANAPQFFEGLSIGPPKAPLKNDRGDYGEPGYKGNGMHFWHEAATRILEGYQGRCRREEDGWTLSVQPLRVSDGAYELFMVYDR